MSPYLTAVTTALTVACAASLANAAVIASRVVDGFGAQQDFTKDSNTGSFSSDSQGGLSVQSGDNFLTGLGFNNNVVATTEFAGLSVQPGTYVVTFQVGERTDTSGGLSAIGGGLTAGGTTNVIFNNTAGITATYDRPDPAPGQFVTYTYTYEVPETSSAIGQSLGFRFIAQGRSNGAPANSGFGFDGEFTVDFTPIPEPGAAAAAMGLLGTLAMRRAR